MVDSQAQRGRCCALIHGRASVGAGFFGSAPTQPRARLSQKLVLPLLDGLAPPLIDELVTLLLELRARAMFDQPHLPAIPHERVYRTLERVAHDPRAQRAPYRGEAAVEERLDEGVAR